MQQSAASQRVSRSWKTSPWKTFAIVFPLSCIAGLALLEGLTSLCLLLWGLAFEAPHALAERIHTRYDAELGWVNVPGLSLPDFYGPAKNLTINDQGFRGARSVTKRVPPQKLRIVCSGDSFTLGYGVGMFYGPTTLAY